MTVILKLVPLNDTTILWAFDQGQGQTAVALRDDLSDGMATHFSDRISTKIESPVGVRSEGCARDCSTTPPTLTWKSRYSPRKSLECTVARMTLSPADAVGSRSDSSTSSGRTDTMTLLCL